MDFVTIEWCTPLYQQELDLRHRLLRAPLGLSFSADDLDGEHADTHFGVIDGDALIGVIVATDLSTGVAKLRQMAIEPDHQSEGLGLKLLQHAERSLNQRGFESILLHARDSAVPFFEHAGYVSEGDAFTEVGLPHRKMTKTLTNAQR